MLQLVARSTGKRSRIHTRIDVELPQEPGRTPGKKWSPAILRRLLRRKMGSNGFKDAAGA